MNDTSKSPMMKLDASEPCSVLAAQRTREPLPRRVYVTMRLEEIGVNIVDMAKERTRLTSELKAVSSIGGPGQRQLRQRRAYVAERIEILRREQADLSSEKKSMGPPNSPGGGEKNDKASGAAKTTFN